MTALSRFRERRRQLRKSYILALALLGTAFILAGTATLVFTEPWSLPFSWFWTHFSGKASPYDSDKYVVIGWNDLGMHCIDPGNNPHVGYYLR